jgi:hypothetical protein
MTNIDRELRVLTDPKSPTGAKIAAAATLWHIIEVATKALEPFKAEIRDIAAKDPSLPHGKGTPSVTINGDGMAQVKVVFPGEHLKLLEGLQYATEREALKEYFDPLYKVRLELRNTSPNYLQGFPLDVRTHMAKVTAIVQQTPRVSLKSLQGVEEVG